ncbi:chloride channel protein [Streptomyces griseorubiginosus]|uniref:Ion-transport protein YfeO n=1 Tax=Streptomyces griseorubiginosus TaxID=67304 RepID=A0AAI8KWJ1_9ACTN|nr:chloride channel protein [Streptomyces griseorubiginosus]AYC37037.1 Putative ion-transport protein YfeO [Streptomyces griseorubiginosus]
MLGRPEYRRALVFCGLIGVPVALIAFWFLVAVHQLEQLIWTDWPEDLGWEKAPWWWALPLLTPAGLVVGVVAARFPGRGGHVPAGGLHSGGITRKALPGVLIAALVGLPLGAVLGPEAPLIAMGGGLALLFARLVRAPETEASTALLSAAGAAAAVSALFGNPIVGAVLLIEVAGVGGPQLFAVMLPALLASGVGDLIFTGFVRWTGFETGSLDIGLPTPPPLDWTDVLWALLLAPALAFLVHGAFVGGRFAARFVAARTVRHTALCALAAAVCITLYAVATGRSPAEAALSGESTLSDLAQDPHAWPVGALIAVLAFKGLAYALCLGSLRGGPVFPALFLGGAAGVLLAPLPGLGLVPAMAVGMAASVTAALRLPVSSVVLVVLLLGNVDTVALVVLAAVMSFVLVQRLPQGPAVPAAGERPSDPAPD